MWHEARKQEKKLRGMIVDYRRRAERRREFYEKFKADPTQFIQIHGRPVKIHMDSAITTAAEKSLMPWPGNKDIIIDRFDGRAHLDYIPEHTQGNGSSSTEPPQIPKSKEESTLNYERYRILIQNEITGVSEDKFLHQIHIEEQFGMSTPMPHHKPESKSTKPKAAIAYTYEDSSKPVHKVEAVPAPAPEESDEDVDFDMLLNVDELTAAQKADLSTCGSKFGLGKGEFISFLNRDIQEKEEIRLAKLQEEEKQVITGRKARRERRAFKETILLRKGNISPPSYAATNEFGVETEDIRVSSDSDRSSRSRSPTPQITYITSFGDEAEKIESSNPTIGPSLPSSLSRKIRPIKKSSNYDSNESSSKFSRRRSRSRGYSRSRSKSRDRKKRNRRSTSRSTSSSPRRSTTKHKRSYRRSSRSSRSSSSSSRISSRDREIKNRKRRGRYSRSPSPDSSSSGRKYRQSYRTRSKSRSSSRSRKRWSRRSRSRSRSRSGNRREYRRSHSRSKERRPADKDASRSHPKEQMEIDLSKQTHGTKGVSPKPKLPTPPVRRYYGRNEEGAESSSSSDESDSKSKSRTSVSRNNISETLTKVRNKGLSTCSKDASNSPSPVTKLSLQERLKKRMQIALNKQLRADKEAERTRIERIEQERQDREESLRELSIKLRRRERERRHQTRKDPNDSTYSSSSSSDEEPRSRSKTRSPSPNNY